MEFHPLNILYITTKITQKTTIFNGMSNPIQSILPSLSTCHIRFVQNTWASCVCQQEINGGFPPQLRELTHPGASGAPADPETKIPENWYSSGEFGSLTLDNAAGIARCARCPQVIHNLMWITTVEFGSFEGLPRNYYECANPLTP